jgi:hypothetical protein
MSINTNQLINLAYNSTSIKSLEGHFFYNYCFTYLYKYRKSAKNAQINIMIVKKYMTILIHGIQNATSKLLLHNPKHSLLLVSIQKYL